jgi:hypothetical protein
MREHARPEVFPEHLQPYLLPMPSTADEAFELLLLLRCADAKKKPGPPPETGHGRNEKPER